MAYNIHDILTYSNSPVFVNGKVGKMIEINIYPDSKPIVNISFERSGDSPYYQSHDISEIKLILKHLRDITEEDAIEVAKMICYSPNSDPNVKITFVKTGNTVGARCSSPHFTSDEYYSLFYETHTAESLQKLNHNCPSIEVGWYSDKIREKTININNPKVWLFLIRNGYDVLYLIENNLAIDNRLLNEVLNHKIEVEKNFNFNE